MTDDELESQADPTLDFECPNCTRWHRTREGAERCCSSNVQRSGD